MSLDDGIGSVVARIAEQFNTVTLATADAVVYVSPDGDDGNAGLSPGKAFATPAAAASALPTDGGVVVILAGTYEDVTQLPDSSNITYYGPAGANSTVLHMASGESLLAPTTNLSGLAFKGLWLSTDASTGHLVDLGSTGGLHHVSFEDIVFVSESAGASIIHQNGSGSFVSVDFVRCQFNRLATATVPAVNIINTAGAANDTTWRNCTVYGNNTTGAPAIRIEASASGTYAYDHTFDGVIGEQNPGGLIHLFSVNNVSLNKVADYDATTTYAASVIKVGKSATNTSLSRQVFAVNSGRRGGTLGSGKYDFEAVTGEVVNVTVANLGNSSTTPVISLPAGALDLTDAAWRLPAHAKNSGVSDADAVTESGWYYWGDASSIGLTDAQLVVIAYDDSWVTQVAYDFYTAASFRRYKTTGGWTSWVAQVDASTTGRTTAQVTNSTVTYATVTGLSVNVLAGKAYKIRITGTYRSAATTTGIGFRLNGTATATALDAWSTIWGAATSVSTPQKAHLTTLTGAHLTTATFASGTDYMFELEGTIRVNAAGTLRLEFASEVASSQVLVQPDASMVLTPLV